MLAQSIHTCIISVSHSPHAQFAVLVVQAMRARARVPPSTIITHTRSCEHIRILHTRRRCDAKPSSSTNRANVRTNWPTHETHPLKIGEQTSAPARSAKPATTTSSSSSLAIIDDLLTVINKFGSQAATVAAAAVADGIVTCA